MVQTLRFRNVHLLLPKTNCERTFLDDNLSQLKIAKISVHSYYSRTPSLVREVISCYFSAHCRKFDTKGVNNPSVNMKETPAGGCMCRRFGRASQNPEGAVSVRAV